MHIAKKFAVAVVLAIALAVAPLYASADVITGTVIALPGATAKTILSSSSATACTSLEVNATGSGRVLKVMDSSNAGQTVVLTLYDEGTSPTCVTADKIYAVQLLQGQVVTIDVPLAAGLAYTLSAAAASNIVITRN
jgi:hypothetical protein